MITWEMQSKVKSFLGLCYARTTKDQAKRGLYWQRDAMGTQAHAIELRTDSQAHQLEWMHDRNNWEHTRWYFVIRWERKRKNWAINLRVTFWAFRPQVGPLGILIPRHQGLEPRPDY